MTLAEYAALGDIEPVAGSVRVVVLSPDPHAVRGSAAEYRRHGFTLVIRDDILAALTEAIRDQGTMFVIAADVTCTDLRDVIDLAVAACGSSVVLARVASTDASTVAAALRAGVRTTVELPLTPERLKQVVRVAPLTGIPRAGEGAVSVGRLTIDPVRYRVEWDGSAFEVTPREFSILLAIARAYPRIATLDELAMTYAGNTSDPNAAVRVVVNHLRNRIASLPGVAQAAIETVRAVGYRLVA